MLLEDKASLTPVTPSEQGALLRFTPYEAGRAVKKQGESRQAADCSARNNSCDNGLSRHREDRNLA
jgi:hypothetical protein